MRADFFQRNDGADAVTAILGISAFYHDSAAALVVDGEIAAAAQEERFSRVKHDPGFPSKSIEYCLDQAGLTPADLDYVTFYEKPFRKFERLLETYLSYAPIGFQSFTKAIPQWVGQKLFLRRAIGKGLPGYDKRLVFPEHHESHAASAFYPSPFEEAAILTLDGVGEWATTTLGVGSGSRIELTHHLKFPHSVGLLYSAFTYYLGFKVNSGEYKVMGLAPYGTPRYADQILEELIDLKADGSFRLNMSYFNYCQGLTMTSKKFHRLFGGPPRVPESPLTAREMDLAASIQKVCEDVMLRSAKNLHESTGLSNLCLAGGVALNCVGNGRILRESPFDKIWIQPAAGDAGGALGSALFVWHQLLENPRDSQQPDSQSGSYLGPQFATAEVREELESEGSTYRELPENQLVDEVADLIAEGKVVGWFQGRMEFGPRALGARSILGDATNAEMQKQLNLKIKFRESFRPFAPAVVEEEASKWFELGGVASPYMLLVAQVPQSIQIKPSREGLTGLDLLNEKRSKIPAVTHVDGSARIQTVHRDTNPRYHELIRRVEERTGVPVIVNTSFNIRGEPIVCTPAEAYRCFMVTEMDALVVEDFLMLKRDQPPTKYRTEEHLQKFDLD